jgi:hypothetical protein
VYQVLIVLAVIAGLIVFVLVSPTKPCRCAGQCGRCQGTGRRFRIGARLVRRAIVQAHTQARPGSALRGERPAEQQGRPASRGGGFQRIR